MDKHKNKTFEIEKKIDELVSRLDVPDPRTFSSFQAQLLWLVRKKNEIVEQFKKENSSEEETRGENHG